MDEIEHVFDIFNQLYSCTNLNDVKRLRKRFNRSNIGNREKSPMLSDADISGELDNLIKGVEHLTAEVHGEIGNLVGENFTRYIDEISHLLTNDKGSSIGVCGMGGVGKTTLVRHLHNMMLTQPDIYGFIYWVTVSKDCSIEKLQNDIANRIGESISDKVDESQRAELLAKALKEKKKFVLILDDVGEYYDLNEVGLGSPKEIRYRLIVTSRAKNVCLKLPCNVIIKVEPLSPKNAWTLFVENIGHEIPDNLRKISTDVLQESAGLPLRIITLAESMIGCTDIYEWKNVLNILTNPSCKVEEKVFKVLSLRYERLKDDEMKKCFLYCATYPEDYEIEINELVWLFIDAGLLGKNVGITKMFDKGLVILKNLESAALLSIKLKFSSIVYGRDGSMGREEKVVVLHDLIRDMALQIAGSRFMIKAESGLKGVPNEESWTDELEVVSLMENEIQEISNFSQKCTKLSILLLQRNYILGCVGDRFFKYLHGLKHLDLSSSCITTLPESISQLTNLTSLILRHCRKLIELPSLAELSYLERLDLHCTDVMQLPKGIENLIKLRYLNLYYTRIETIGAGIISKLTALQYLATKAAFEVKELKSLHNFEHLTIFFKDFYRFSEFSTEMKIKGRPNSYNFIFGVDLVYHNKYIMRNWQSEKQIFLNDHKLNLWNMIDMERTLELICDDVNMLHIECEADLMSLGDFVLDSASNLQGQSEIKRGPEPFFNLETLIIERCSNMKMLFPLGLLTNLQNIKAIKICHCEGLKALIEEANDETKVGGTGHPQNFSLPKLKQLVLNDLPNLDNLCSNNKVIHTPSLEWISISGCLKLKRMPFVVDNQHQPFPQMMYPKSDKKWIKSLEWDPPESKSKITFICSE